MAPTRTAKRRPRAARAAGVRISRWGLATLGAAAIVSAAAAGVSVSPAEAAPPPLIFGVYPGGAAGTVGPSGPIKPEDSAKRLSALEQLRAPGRPFVLHLYASYTAPDGWSAAQQVGQQIADYESAGFEIELVLTYRPADGGSSTDVQAFASFVRDAVRAFGPSTSFVSLQVTNEANVVNAPNAADGYYVGAKDALIQGVIAAKDEIRGTGFDQVKVGFNWAYATGRSERSFWSYLGKRGGPGFIGALDWVGIDAYPGTWGHPLGSGTLSVATKTYMDNALSVLRSSYLPLGHIPATTPLYVTENGYPTGPGRTDAMQVTVMTAAITALSQARGAYNVTNYRWFDLRDADSSSSSFESQYGLMTDDYSPKPAFAAYQQLIGGLSAPQALTMRRKALIRHRSHRQKRR